MKASIIKFNKHDRPEFVKELKKRVNKYFEDNKISKKANWNMKLKTVFMLLLYFTPFVLMLTGVFSSFWPVLGMWILMGFGMSGIGLSIMHDANHGSYSKNKYVNQALGYLSNFLGAYHKNWRIQHNLLHHSYTNIDGLDGDLETPAMRFSPNQKRRKLHKFQLFYAPFFYSIMTIYWSIAKDFVQIANYKKRDLLVSQGLSTRKAIFQVSFNKLWYFALTLVLPIILVPIAWWQIILGFVIMHLICGLVLALIFQPAHVIEETDFFEPIDKGEMENNWAIHQLRTTANFAHKSVLFSWFIGGLNYQIEHHLFPNICHVHHKKISGIVKKTAEEFNLTYMQHKTFFGALKSHFSMLHKLGTGKYDKMLVKAQVPTERP